MIIGSGQTTFYPLLPPVWWRVSRRGQTLKKYILLLSLNFSVIYKCSSVPHTVEFNYNFFFLSSTSCYLGKYLLLLLFPVLYKTYTYQLNVYQLSASFAAFNQLPVNWRHYIRHILYESTGYNCIEGYKQMIYYLSKYFPYGFKVSFASLKFWKT